MPYLLDTKIKVKFDGIKINSERQLFEGKLVTTYDKTEKNIFEPTKEIKGFIETSSKINEIIDKAIAQGFLTKEDYEILKKNNTQNIDRGISIITQLKEKNILTEEEYSENIEKLKNSNVCLENNDCITEKGDITFLELQNFRIYGMSFIEDDFYLSNDNCIEKIKDCKKVIEKNDNSTAVAYLSNERELKDSIPAYYMNSRGFWINGKENFGEYIGNVPPSTDRYYELVEIEGVLYHKNTNTIHKKAINTILGTTWIEKKEYDISEESLNDAIRMGSDIAITGLVIKSVAGAAGEILKSAGNSLWKVAPLDRGFVYEKMLNLKGKFNTPNFPVIDAFYQGVATSVKTVDLTAKSYLKGKAVFNTLKGYIDKLANFKGATWGKDIVEERFIKSKILEIGIPRGVTSEQIKQINQAIQYGKSQGIQVNIRVVK
ncbi:hypothetical protein ACI76O_11770 [Capnocytophaga cynodegmi]|uniref:endonuclease toxin domain-containing protein n=1 Tax=Capnocytophaga cynodegmi TaxID=28189 RepID=UPI0038591B7C